MGTKEVEEEALGFGKYRGDTVANFSRESKRTSTSGSG